MAQVFGTDRSSEEANAWATHWTQMQLYEENLREGGETGVMPKSLWSWGVFPDVPPGPAQKPEQSVHVDGEMTDFSQLSNSVLQDSAVDRKNERQTRMANGNIPPQLAQVQKIGRRPNTLCLKLAIERKGTKWEGDTVFKEVKEAGCMASTEKILSGEGKAPAVRQKKRKIETEDDGQEAIPFICDSSGDSSDPPLSSSQATQGTLEASWGETQITAIFVDSGFFRDFVKVLCPGYKIPDCSNFFATHIASEAVNVAGHLLNFLTQFIHLMLSFDRWTSKGGEEIYTVHITTPARRSFLIDGLDLTGKSTNADSLYDLISKIICDYAAFRFSMIVLDTTDNVKKCRQLICNQWPWVLNCPDPCHQLNLMMKDVMLGSKKHPKIKGFSDSMRIVSQITTYFSHSNYRKYHLRQELTKETSKHGIVAGGPTRFSTFATHVRSIICCSDAMARCFDSGVLKFDTAATKELQKYIRTGSDWLKSLLDLNTIDLLLQPIARGLTTLEGQNTTCSDIFFVFIGIAIGFNCVFEDPEHDIFQYRSETLGVFN
ncbi:hypothetical protein EV361DRAFT_1037172 [Lentinula raphanica]|nr:hypothetical protein EV361DRAFT_1037172 [Lentinula raphanica]